nr:ATP-binding cassette domain-containing protein [Blautia sp. AM47-4]
MEEKIRIENVTKKFGSYAALDGISLSFEKGKIHGMIGRNGSGKTVLFKCICGFLRVDDGAVFVDGKQIGKEIEAPESIGAIIETPGFLPGYSARQNLQFLAGIRRKIGKRRSMRPSEKSDWIRKRKSMSASIRSACASVSVLHRRLWRNLPF